MANNIDMYLPGFNAWDDKDLLKRREQLPYFRSMVLNGPGITDQGIALLKDCKKIRELHLMGTRVTNVGLARVAELTTLDWLVIDGGLGTDSGMRSLSSLQGLKSLQLIETMVSEEGLDTIFHYPELQYLEAAGESLGGNAVSIISRQPSINTVRISSQVIDDSEFMNFAFCSGLKSLTFDLPRVSRRAQEELKESLPGCLIQNYSHFVNINRFRLIVESAFEFYEEGKYTWTINALDDAARINRSHPVIRGLKAFSYLKLGKVEGFRDHMEAVLDTATISGDRELIDFAKFYLYMTNQTTLSLVVAKEEPHRELKKIIDRKYEREEKIFRHSALILPNRSGGTGYIQPVHLRLPEPAFPSSRLNEQLGRVQYEGYIEQPRPELILLDKIRMINKEKKERPGTMKSAGKDRQRKRDQPPWTW